MITNNEQDSITLKTLYKFFTKGIIMSDHFFENYVDRREFLNNLVLAPLIEIGVSLQSHKSDNLVETLKKARALLQIVLSWVAKTVIVRNSNVFTENIIDNEVLVNLIQTFSQFEVEQYMSLFERFSRSPKTLRLNLEIYSMFCKLLRTLVNCMTHHY